MTPPVPKQPATGLFELRIYDRTGAYLATISGNGLAWTHGKGVDSSSLSCSASFLEATMTTDLLDDTIGIVYGDLGAGMVPVATPYVLAPGSGTTIGERDAASQESQPVGQGALMLTNEMLVLHYGAQVNRRGPRERYWGWQSPEFSTSGWQVPLHTDPASLSASAAKHGEPKHFPDPDAVWVHRDPSLEGDGNLILMRPLSGFTVTAARKIRIQASADEEFKAYLFGPGWGGVIMESYTQETGYTESMVFEEVLQPGTYTLAFEMTTIASEGGDGFDAIRFCVNTVSNKGKAQLPSLLKSGDGERVWPQSKNAPRPGLSVGHIVRDILADNAAWGVASADLLTDDFGDNTDSDGTAWGDLHEMSWPVGTTLAQVLADLQHYADFDVDTSFNLKAWDARGDDVSATVQFVEADNVLALSWQGLPVQATRFVVLSGGDRFVEVIGYNAEENRPARAAYLESQQAASIGAAKRLGRQVLRDSKRILRTYDLQVLPEAGALPWADFTVGDTITALDYRKLPGTLDVVSISGQQTDAGVVAFDLELVEFEALDSGDDLPTGAMDPHTTPPADAVDNFADAVEVTL